MAQEQVVVGVLLAAMAVLVLGRWLGSALRLACRTAVGAVVLAALSQVGGAFGLSLGVNWCNALVLGVLGAPGLGLLMLANLWVK
jgi:inhibitor of the pro-sigma K processing machinery